MKYIFIFLALIITLTSSAQTSNPNDEVYMFCYFNNNGKDGLHLAYSLDGYQWKALNHDSSFLKPVLSKDSLMRDPCIIKGADGLFHMVWTVSWKQRGIGYASSPDLIHWSNQQFLPVMEQEPTAQNCWAPEITYNKKQDNYMIYWATTISGRFPETDSGGDYNHRLYQITTKDFKTYTPTRLLYNQGFNVIDATIVPNDNQFVMFLKDETKNPPQKNIRIAYSNNLESGFGKPSNPITGNYWAEGPTTLKINNKWVVYFDRYRDHRYGAIESTDLKTWTDISNKISLPKGIRHGSIFKVSKAELEKLIGK